MRGRPGVVILQAPREPDDMVLRHLHLSVQDPLPPPDKLKEALRILEQMFPNICRKGAVARLRVVSSTQPNNFERAMEIMVDYFLRYGFPEATGASTSSAAAKAEEGADVVDLSSSDSDEEEEAECYREWCTFRLDVDFPRVSLLSLMRAFKVFGNKLDPAYRAVNFQYTRAARKKSLNFIDVGPTANEASENTSWLPKGKLKLLKKPRIPQNAPVKSCPHFEKEWAALQSEFRKSVDLDGKGLLEDFCNDIGAPDAGEVLVECGCCCSENPFEGLVQCADGHLFCADCLRRHLEGYIFGGLQSFGLPTCLDTHGCDKTFPWSEVKKALPLEVLSKYEQRQAEDAVARAKLEGLVYCPFCNHPWEVDRGMAVLHCLNETCKKASCIKCKEANHQPLRCEDVETKSSTSLRRKVEELMTKALIRECSSCKAELVKVEGCNKITCRCGQNMCYVCRKAIKDYSHFCQHVREPGKSCVQCTGCSLWERENEAAVVKAAKVAAMQEVTVHEPSLLKREIGPSENIRHGHKKPRTVQF